MIRTASLRGRVLLAGIGVVTVTLVLVDIALYFALRESLRDDVAELVDDRRAFASALVDDLSPPLLLDRLSRAGIPARVVQPDGDVLESGPLTMLPDAPVFSEAVPLPGGGSVEVVATLARVEQALHHLVELEALGTLFGVCLASLLLIRQSRRALRPLDTVVSTARAIASGRTGERLRPRGTDTEIGRLAAAFDEMLDAEAAVRERLARLSELNRRFLADAAHQIRTPLAGMQACVELLAMSPGPEERQRLLKNLAVSTERAGLLIGALLRMAAIDEGPAPPTEPTDLVALCNAELERLSLTTAVELRLETDGRSYAHVPLDANSMREAIGNVLDNACRHAASRVDVRVASSNGTIAVTVRDDGPGMDDQTAALAFERFRTFGTGQGVGLGLSIARGIAEAHGGQLVYEDRTFVLRVPAHRPAPQAPAT